MGSYAGVIKRMAAWFIDYLLIITYAALLFGIASIVYILFFDGLPDTGRVADELIAFFTLVFPVFLYFFITESGIKHSTIGKRKMKIWIAATNGSSPTLFQVILRNVVKLLPWQVAHTFIFTGMHNDWQISAFTWIIVVMFCYVLTITSFLLLCFRKDHRAVHDILADTVVLSDSQKKTKVFGYD
ncbi:RDD family protein [Virgibacillus ihumii]|uniref:RDD family protein n=1 Tax=Virgibacillus ihumii TaxID=2686091 RepID=UPI00157CD270|nr:RDD family protein [Virgibacillus ihumii]